MLVLTVVWPALAWSQIDVTDQAGPPEHAPQSPTSQGNPAPTPPPDAPVVEPTQNPAPQDKKDAAKDKKDDPEGQQSNRMFYVIPNFAAMNANTQLPPLSAREKFVLATKDSLGVSGGNKIFVHCRVGDDRTGMMIAAYRTADEGWTPKQAMEEMNKYGFSLVHRRLICPRLSEYEEHFPERFATKPGFVELRSTKPSHPS